MTAALIDGNVTGNDTGAPTPPESGDAERPRRDRDGEHDPASFDRLVRSGLAWSVANNAIERVVTLASGIILARILDPKDYGVFAVSLTALLFLMALNDIGLSLALVRWPGPLDPVGPTATTLIMAWSFLLFGCFIALAGPFADAMGAPEAAPVVRLMSLALVIDAIGAVPTVAITRGLQQNRRTVAEFGGSIIGTPLTIGLAVAGFGAWSLAWGHLAKNVIATALLMGLSPHRYLPGWNGPHARELLRHGLPIAATTLLSFGLLNFDYLVIGHTLGAVSLGLYVFAFNLSSFPVTVIINALRRVSLAAFSRLHHDDLGLRSGFTRAFALTVAAVVPISALLVGFAPDLIHFVYGSKWDGAIDVLRILAVVGGVRAVLDLSSDLFTAVGKARWTLAIHGLWLVVLIPALIVGVDLGGIEGAGIAHLVVALAVVLPLYLYWLHRAGMAVGAFCRECVRPLIGGVVLTVVAIGASRLIDGAFGTLALGGIFSMIAYLAIVAPMRRLVRTPEPEPAPGTP